MEWISIAIFLFGVAFGMVLLRIIYHFTGEPEGIATVMSPDEFKDFIKELDENIEGATVAEMFDDLEDDDEA